MACGRKACPRILATILTTALIWTICAVTLTPSAAARVSVVPGSLPGGGIQTFAVRLSNEQPDLTTTRLELAFPTDLVIPLVDVAPVRGWDATVDMRPLDPPVTVDGKEVDEAVDSIVWTGGEVRPKQFEQFLVTAGPLPAEGGRLVLAAVQGYEDGSTDRWTAPAEPGWPGAPTVVITPHPDAAPTDRSAESGDGTPVAAGSGASGPVAGTEGAGMLPWILLVAGLLVAGVGGVLGYQRREQRRHALRRRPLTRTKIDEIPPVVGPR